MSCSRLGYGIIGCGAIGPSHAQAVASLPGARLLAVADLDLARARALAAKYGADTYGDLNDLLARDDIQAVSICTPSGYHAEHAIAAMRAGKHVVVEKPIAVDLAAADQMLATAEETGRKLSVIGQNRFAPDIQAMKGALDEGRLGRIVLANSHTIWYRSREYYNSGAWRGTWALDGGGALMNQSVHYVDLLIWMLGPVESVVAYAATLTHQIEVEDTAAAILRFQSGALASIEGTTSAYPGIATHLAVYGEKGSFIIENNELRLAHFWRDGEQVGDYGGIGQELDHGKGCGSTLQGDLHRAQLADVIEAIEEDRQPEVSGLDGRRALEVVSAIYESSRSRREVRLV